MTSAARPSLRAEHNRELPDYSQLPESAGGSEFAVHPLILINGAALMLALIAAAECQVFARQSISQAPILPDVSYGLILWYWWGLVATVIWKFAERSGKDFFSLSSAVKQGFVSLLLAGAHLWLLQWNTEWARSQWLVLRSATPLDYFTVNRFFFELLLYGFMFGVTGVIHLQSASQRDKMRALSLERQLSAAHLRALQMQMEPHFLFNTLNAITSLVEQGQKEQALGTLRNLNSILRSALRRGTPEKVLLAQELALIDDYLSIEVTRFADRLQLNMNIDPGALNAQMPCFLLQPIVENAIHHGISRCEESGSIELKAERSGDRLYLIVRNTGPIPDATPSQPGHGIGLTNTQERLALLYGDDCKFRADVLASGGFEVYIDIPYEHGGQ